MTSPINDYRIYDSLINDESRLLYVPTANTWLLWTSIGVTFGIEIYIFCCNGGRTFPSNMVLLGIFTFCEGYIVSFISSATGHQSGNGTVLLAAGLTMGNFKNNFSCCNCMYSLCLLH